MKLTYDAALVDAPAFVKDALTSLDKGDFDAAMSVATEAFVKACSSTNVANKCFALVAIAKIQLSLGDFSDAKGIIEKAKEDVAGSNDSNLKGIVEETAASVYGALGKTKQALDTATAAEGFYKGKVSCEASAMITKASVFLSGGKKQDAIKECKKAVQLFRECRSKEGEAAALYAQTYAFLSRQKSDEALRSANELLGLYEGSDSVDKEAMALLAVADCHATLGDSEEGQEKAQKAVDFFEDARMPGKQAAALLHLGKLCVKGNNATDGWAYMKEAQELSRQCGSRKVEADVMMELAIGHARAGSFMEFHNFAEEGVTICRLGGDYFKAQLAAFLTEMCLAYQQAEASGFAQDQHLNWKARTCGKEALSIYQELNDPRGQSKALVALGGAFLAYGNALEARAKAKESVEICLDLGDKAGEGMAWLLISQTKIHENKEEAVRCAAMGQKLCKESFDSGAIADAEAIVDFIRTFTGEKKEKSKAAKGPAVPDSQSDKTDIIMDIDSGRQRAAFWWGFTARTARMRRS